jgi:hypothetical protein
MSEMAIGGVVYRLLAAKRNDQWVAHAERADTGAPFGVECSGPSEADALTRLGDWLSWQSEHATALAALQEAEHDYHRAVAGSAFANPTEGPTPFEIQREALDRVEAARQRLDEVRGRRPGP